MLFKIKFFKICFLFLVLLLVTGLFSLQLVGTSAETSDKKHTPSDNLNALTADVEVAEDLAPNTDSEATPDSSLDGANLAPDAEAFPAEIPDKTYATTEIEEGDGGKKKNKDGKKKNKDGKKKNKDGKTKNKKYPSSGSFRAPAMNGFQSRASLPLLPSSRIKGAKLPDDLSSLKFNNKLIRLYGKNLVKVTKRIDSEIAPVQNAIVTTTATLDSLTRDINTLSVHKIELDLAENQNTEHYFKVVSRLGELSKSYEETNIILNQLVSRESVLNSEKSRIYEILGFYKAVDNLIRNTPFPKSQVKPLLLSTAGPLPSFPSKNLQSRSWNSLHGLTYSDIGPNLLSDTGLVVWKAPLFESATADSFERSLPYGGSVAENYGEIFAEMKNFNPLLAVRVDKSVVEKVLATPHARKMLALPIVDLKVGGRVLTVAGVDGKAATILDVSAPPTESLAVFSTGAQSALSIKSGDLVEGQKIKHANLSHGGIEPFKSKREIKTAKTQLTAGAFQDLPLGIGALVDVKYVTGASDYIVLFNNDTAFRGALSYLDKFNKKKAKEGKILRRTAAPSVDMFYSQSEAGGILGSGSFVKIKSKDPDAIALPSSFVSKHIKTQKFPVLGTFPCSRFGAKQLAGALAQAAVAGLGPSLIPDNFGGCFSSRFMRTKPKPSYHAWGLAIDLDPSHNQLYSRGTLDRRLVPIFKSWGFRWGGDWRTLDPMHFEIAKLLK